MEDLLSGMNKVETPFIIAEIGGVSFGAYESSIKNTRGHNINNVLNVTYPNFMKSLTVTKINGTVNIYNLQMVYAIRHGDDPNLLEKVFSKAKKDRTIYLSYGDLSTPSYIYKKEEALITDITSDIDFSSSKITYNISCTSKGILGNSTKFDFPKRVAKPSDVIKELLYNRPDCGLLEIFYGMTDRDKVIRKHLIAANDTTTVIEAKVNISPLEYLKYLVMCMIPVSENPSTVIKSSMYRFCIIDNIGDEFEGPYFKVVQVMQNIRKDTIDVYNINVGFPDNNIVMNFSLQDNQVYSIFYDYAKDVNQPSYIQRIDNQGNLISEYSPAFSNSSQLLKTTSSDKTWWTTMVSYPLSATLVIKGLLKPAILMSYIYIDAMFFGAQHYSSGYYMITKQVDSISASGFRTTLSLLRVGGDGINGN